MDLNNLSKETAKQLSSFVENTIYFYGNPILRHEPIETSTSSTIVRGFREEVVEKKEKFNPSLFYYALICISLGTAIQATIPNDVNPSPIENVVLLIIILVFWFLCAGLVTLPTRWLSKSYHSKMVFSITIQVLSTLYFTSSVLAFLAWMVFDRSGAPFGFAEGMWSLWYYPFHIILSFIYLPWAILKTTSTTGAKGFFLTVCILILILIFESLSVVFWSMFHFAGFA